MKIRVFAVVGRGGHQEEVPGSAAQEFAQLVALGLFRLAAEIVG